MICSEWELDLGKDADGIMVLDDAAAGGTPSAQELGLTTPCTTSKSLRTGPTG